VNSEHACANVNNRAIELAPTRMMMFDVGITI